jgi:hypothetical protein
VRAPAGICALPSVELANGAVATSVGTASRGGARIAQRIVSVVAPLCVVADALTKVLLARDDAVSRRVLALFAAQAMQSSGRTATLIGAAA